MNGENEKEYVPGLLVKTFTTKFGEAISLHFINEDEFLDFFISKVGIYKGGLKLTAFKKKESTAYSTHYTIVNNLQQYHQNIESDYAKQSDNNLNEIDDETPF
ncbi:MAG: hypothetical protein JXR64_02870 [Spirochaetales bacterium]|nr:hypothetical protein [Spirochaetales bacterium]